jgi:hypothetical protein
MAVETLRDVVGTMASLTPSSLQLMSGGIPLRLGSVLGDYFALFGPYGLAVQVVSTVASDERGSLPEHGVSRLKRSPLSRGDRFSREGELGLAWRLTVPEVAGNPTSTPAPTSGAY